MTKGTIILILYAIYYIYKAVSKNAKEFEKNKPLTQNAPPKPMEKSFGELIKELTESKAQPAPKPVPAVPLEKQKHETHFGKESHMPWQHGKAGIVDYQNMVPEGSLETQLSDFDLKNFGNIDPTTQETNPIYDFTHENIDEHEIMTNRPSIVPEERTAMINAMIFGEIINKRGFETY